MLSRLHVRDLFQSPPHALGVAKFVLGGLCGSVCAPVRNGNLARCEDRLRVEAAQFSHSSSLQRVGSPTL